jgi:hypothetical protein
VLDLGFFNAIQSIQHTKKAYSVESLIVAVRGAFAEMQVRTLEKCFLTLQAVMEQIMLVHGDNKYELPRVGAFKGDAFPHALLCSDEAYSTGTSGLKPK